MSAPLPLHGLDRARILVRGVNWLGDAVMTTPALLRLRQAWPAASITLLTPEKLRDLWLDHPALNAVLTFHGQESARAVGKRLRAEKFDLGLALPNSFRSALELWLAGIPQRLGYRGQWRRWLLTHPTEPRADALAMRKRSSSEIRRLVEGTATAAQPRFSDREHHIYQYLHLVAQLGAEPTPIAPHLRVSDAEVEAVLSKLNMSKGTEKLFGLNAGAEYGPAKRWPLPSFIAAAREIQRKTDCRWVVVGGAGDRAMAQQVVEGLQQPTNNGEKAAARAPLNLAGETSLRELCAILKACQVLLTNDTGPMHVAAAVGTAVVVPFGSTSPHLTGPGLPGDPRHRLLHASVPCSPCFLRQCPIDFRCMHQITVPDVVEAVCRAAA